MAARGRSTRAYLSGWFELPLAAGDWQLGARMQQPGDSIGAYYVDSHLEVDAGNALALSDIVTGIATGPRWHAPDGGDFPVNTLRAWEVGKNAELYYEVRGLAVGAEYRTTIEVHARDKTLRQQAITVATTDHATGATTWVRKTLGLTGLKPGDYIFSVTVSAGAQTATRTGMLVVAKPLR